MEKIGIFCSACEQIAPQYVEYTQRLGAWMGRHGKTLVYGGADMGLMECVARAVKEQGGYVIGVVPDKLEERGRVSALPDKILHTDTLSRRKDVIVRESDILVALPGGVGTLDEVFHVVAAATIGYHRKQVVLYNIGGFWNPLLALLDKMQEGGFIRKPLKDFLVVADSPEEIETMLSSH